MCPLRKCLQRLVADEAISLSHLDSLKVPLEEFAIHVKWSSVFHAEAVRKLNYGDEEERVSVPLCLRSLRKLSCDSGAALRLKLVLASIFEACTDLQDLSIEENMPAKWARLLPRKLVSFSGIFTPLNASVFQHLPKSLRSFNYWESNTFIFGSVVEYCWHDLYQLPHQLRSFTLPLPMDAVYRCDVEALLEDIAREFHQGDIEFKIGFEPSPVYSYSYTPKSTLLSLVTSERRTRSVLDPIQDVQEEKQAEKRRRNAKRKRS